jgi:hypothetical protein
MKLGATLGVAFVGAVIVAACDDDATDTTGTASTTTSSSSTGGSGGDGGVMTPAESCVQPGDVGNDKGVGTYCTPAGSECEGFPEAPLCLASVGQDQWFCTRIGCDETTDCGEEAGCLFAGGGSACVPCRCDATGIGCEGGGGGGGSGGAAGAGGAGGA